MGPTGSPNVMQSEPGPDLDEEYCSESDDQSETAEVPPENQDGFEDGTKGTVKSRVDIGIGQVDSEDVESVLGFSISRAASVMRSATTPATEKARVLEASGSYFDVDEAELEEDEKTPNKGSREQHPEAYQLSDESLQQATPRHNEPFLSTGSAAQERQHMRPEQSRSILAETFALTRKRASSASAAAAESLRKMLPELPKVWLRTPSLASLLPATKSNAPNNRRASPLSITPATYEDAQKHVATADLSKRNTAPGAGQSSPGEFQPGGHSSRESNRFGSSLEKLPVRTGNTPELSPTKLEYNQDDSHTANPYSPSLRKDERRPVRRSTSADSLFLHRAATGASSFDDFARFQDISEQHNPRFKAIADTWADSSLRWPKMPNINLTAFRPGAERLKSVQTTHNAMENPQRCAADSSFLRPSTVPQGASDHPGHTAPKQKALACISCALDRMKGDLVVMGGYRGSVLRTAQPPYRQVWAPLKVGLKLRKVDLEVGLTEEDEKTMEERIIPSGVLSHIGPIDICRRLLRHLRECSNAQSGALRIHDYGYDWRLSPHLLSQQLIRYLENLKCNQTETPGPQKGAWIIAHSLGGLITRHAINQRPELFAGVVYAGTPQHCVNILGPLRNGDEVLMSSRVLTAQVNFTLRTSYALLPLNGMCFIDKATSERYNVDFFDPRTWEEYRLSPCIKPPFGQLGVPKEPRKSLMNMLQDSLPLSNRRASWFGWRDTLPLEDSGVSAKSTNNNSDQSAVNPESSLKQTLEPAMGSSSSSAPHRPSESIRTACSIPPALAKAYLSHTLARVKQFKIETSHNAEHENSNIYPPQAIIFGKTVPTVFGARVVSREAIKHTDAYDDLVFAAGDGVVLASAAQLPKGYKCVRGGRIHSERGHVGLLGDFEAVGRCLDAIVEARERGVGLGPEGSKRSSGQQQS